MQVAVVTLALGLALLSPALGQAPRGSPVGGRGRGPPGGRGGPQGGRGAAQPSAPPTPPSNPTLDLVKHLDALQARFRNTIDPNFDGVAQFPEVQMFLQKYKPLVDNATVQAFINRRDLNGNGVVDFIPDFVFDIMKPGSPDVAAKEWFGLEDTNGDGFVTRNELVAIAQNIGFSKPDAEAAVDSYYSAQDKNKDGKLSFEEYKSLYIARQK